MERNQMLARRTPKRVLLWLVFAAVSVAGAQGCDNRADLIQEHANLLAQGNVSPRGPDYSIEEELEYAARGVPYHLVRLIQMGSDSSPALLHLLSNTRPVDIYYLEAIRFEVHSLEPYTERHQATVADLADYGLSVIYHRDVGFRSYLPELERQRAIAEWHRVVGEHSRSDK